MRVLVLKVTPHFAASLAASDNTRGISSCSTCAIGPPSIQMTCCVPSNPCACPARNFLTPPVYVWNHLVSLIIFFHMLLCM